MNRPLSHRSAWIIAGPVLVLLVFTVTVGGTQQDDTDGPPTGSARDSIHSRPLNTRPTRGGSLFQSLDPSATGLDHLNPLRFDHERWIRFTTTFAGGGVAIGDYDRDGRPDVFITGQLTDSKLYRQTGDFRFTDVTERTGIHTRDRWSSGAAFADVNDDGWLDLYVCNYRSANELYINKGDGTFAERAADYHLDYDLPSVKPVFSDYDRDGDLDLYLLTWREIDLGSPTRGCEMIGSSPHLRVRRADRKDCQVFNPEGREPIIKKAGYRDLLLRNDQGMFTDVTKTAGLQAFDIGNDAVWTDYNRDGWPDLYVANDFWDPDHLYRNEGDGSFTEVTERLLPHTPFASMGVAAGDLNGDGWPDLVGSDMAGTTHERRKRGMGRLSEFDLWFLTSSKPPQYIRNTVYLNSERHRFREVAFLTGMARTGWTWSVKIHDLNLDGRRDVLFTNGMTKDLIDSDYQNRVNRMTKVYKERFDRAQRRNRGPSPEKWREIWSDTRRHLLKEAPGRREKNMVFQNRGRYQFAESGSNWGFDQRGISFGAAVADLDRDGDLDLVVNNLGDPVSVYENTTADGHGLLVRLKGRESNSYGIGAHLTLVTPEGRQVRYHNPYEGFMSADEPFVHFGLREADRIEKLIIHWPSGLRQTVTGLKPDRFYTVTEPDPGQEEISQSTPGRFRQKTKSDPLFHTSELDFTHSESDFDDMEVQPLLPWKHSRLGPGLAWGDPNGDGTPDLFVGGAAGEAGRLFINRDGKLEPSGKGPWHADADHEDMAALWIDVNGDGDQDLFVASGSSEFRSGAPELEDRIYLNDGDGTFSAAPEKMLPAARVYSGSAAAVDYDRDGDLDLFVGGRMVPRHYPETPRSRLLENRDGRLVDVTGEIAPGLERTGMVTSALWTDANDDGWVDLMLTAERGPIRYFVNRGGKKLVERTKEAGLADTNGLWNGITGTDVNRDGRMEYVVTNFGRNTRYHASPDRPYLLYHGDFNGDGRRELVEALYEGKTLYPYRGRSFSARSMPFIKEKFKTVRSYAQASLSDVYTDDKLRKAGRLAVNRLDSVVLINREKGLFDVRSISVEAQFAPGFGVVASSFDGCPGPDLFLAQNFFSTHPEIGHMDGGVGLVMTSENRDRFRAVSPGRSGISLSGDMMGAAAADVNRDGRPDLAVSRNDAGLVLLKQQSTNDRPPTRIRLIPGEDGTIAGTRVTLRSGDRILGAHEVYAGGGYLSQSSPIIYTVLPPDLNRFTIRTRWPDGTVQQTQVRRARPERIRLEHP